VSASHALIKYGLTLVSASHLSRHVVHLLRVALWAILIHYDFLYALVGLRSLLGRLHPLFPLIEFFPGNDFVTDKVSNVGHVLAETAFGGRGVRSQGEQHATVAAEDG
jgi:hypothetical protein